MYRVRWGWFRLLADGFEPSQGRTFLLNGGCIRVSPKFRADLLHDVQARTPTELPIAGPRRPADGFSLGEYQIAREEQGDEYDGSHAAILHKISLSIQIESCRPVLGIGRKGQELESNHDKS